MMRPKKRRIIIYTKFIFIVFLIRKNKGLRMAEVILVNCRNKNVITYLETYDLRWKDIKVI